MDEKKMMQRALQLAEKGRRCVHPNPMVGALVVKGGRVISEGWHQYYGGPHAEVYALRKAGKRARGATLVVTLEPCCTEGKTPACTDAVIRMGLKRVVIGSVDPNPQHRGRGVRLLRRNGIDVKTGVCQNDVKRQNEAFFTSMQKERPFVTVKLAMSLDGKIATQTHDSQWITSKPSRRLVHELRASSDAVMVGLNTCLADDARLSVRNLKGKWKEPFKVVLDPQLSLSPRARLLTENKPQAVMLVASDQCLPSVVQRMEKTGAHVITVGENQGLLDLSEVMRQLWRRGITSVLVEGGSSLAGSLFDKKLVDKLCFFYAPIVIGGAQAISAVGGEGVLTVPDSVRITRLDPRKIGTDYLLTGYPVFT